MEIKTIRKDRLQNMEHFQFAGHVLAMCKTANIEKLNPLLAPREAAIGKEDEALNLPQKMEGTRELSELDSARDKAYRVLTLLLDACLLDTNKNIAGPAQMLRDILDRYPDTAAQNYAKETAMIQNLITDLNTPEAKVSVGRTNLQGAVARLTAANAAFDKCFQARFKKTIPTGTFDIKALRANTDAALNAVLRRIDSLDDLEPSAKITALINEYNAVIDNRHTLLAGRAATNKAHADKQAEALRKELDPLIRKFEEANGIAPNVLTFTGKTQGTGKKKLYELAYTTDPKRTLWVRKNKEGALQEVKE